MKTDLFKMAAKACKKAYEEFTNLGTTEYSFRLMLYRGEVVKVIIIPGTNELLDWLVNINLFSRKGFKIGSYRAAKKIHKHVLPMLNKYKKQRLFVFGHSKGGATAIVYKLLLGADCCVAFSPARCLKKPVKMDNTTILLDPDDIVPKLAFLSFDHPECEIIEAEDDHIFFSIGDHKIEHMEQWVEFLEKQNKALDNK